MGNVLNVGNNGFIHFQWMGNFADSSSPQGSFRLGWVDTSKNQEYFREKRERHTHDMLTGQCTDTKIHVSEVIMAGRNKILTKDHKFTRKAVNLLRIMRKGRSAK